MIFGLAGPNSKHRGSACIFKVGKLRNCRHKYALVLRKHLCRNWGHRHSVFDNFARYVLHKSVSVTITSSGLKSEILKGETCGDLLEYKKLEYSFIPY